MFYFKSNGLEYHHADYVIDVNNNIISYHDCCDDDKRLVRSVGYGEHVYEKRPLFKRLLRESKMVINLHGCSDPTMVKMQLRKLEEQGYTVIIEMNLMGAKMGGKRFQIFFIGSYNPLHKYFAEVGILEELLALPKAKYFERIKKFLGDWTIFDMAPRIIEVPDGTYPPGVVLATEDWMAENSVRAGFKMSGPMKATILPGEVPIGFDMAIMPSENKCKLPVCKLEKLAGYSPELNPENRYSEFIMDEDADGNPIIGRLPQFGLDVQATLQLRPMCDLQDIQRILDWKFTEVDVRNFFSYKNAENKYCLNHLGRKIFEEKLTLSNPGVRTEVLDVLLHAIRKRMKLKVEGCFGTAAPLSLAPAHVRALAKQKVAIGYSGGLISKGFVIEWNGVIYVEDKVWMAMGRDFDGDLIFVFKEDRFSKSVLVTVEELNKYYILPKKNELPDHRDEIDTITDTLGFSASCGKTYNIGKKYVDACRLIGMNVRRVELIEIVIMAFVEIFLYSTKHSLDEKVDVIDVEFINKKLMEMNMVNEAETKKISFAMKRVTMFFAPLKSSMPIKINDINVHPLEALVNRAQWADPSSRSFYEAACSIFKNLHIPTEAEIDVREEENFGEESAVTKVYNTMKNTTNNIIGNVCTWIYKNVGR